jgi:hypothetical protein
VTFGDDKKGKMVGTDIIKVNDHFILNDVALWTSSGIICFLSLSLLMLIWMFSFANLVREFSVLRAILFLAFLALGRFLS